jgi:hypothetical protein
LTGAVLADSISTGFSRIEVLAKALGEGSEGARIGPSFLPTDTGFFLHQYSSFG